MGCVKDGVWSGLSALHPSNIRDKYQVVRAMTWKQRASAFLNLNMRVAYGIMWLIFMIIWLVCALVLMYSNHLSHSMEMAEVGIKKLNVCEMLMLIICPFCPLGCSLSSST